MPTTPRVAVAGATGNAGLALVHELVERGVQVRALVRSPQKLAALGGRLELRRVELTEPASVRGALDDVDIVVSALGKTNQRGGARRRAVDVDANLSLLAEARRAGVARFGFVSVATARPGHPVAMIRMKAEVESAIEASGLPFTIVQPTGYFSDLWQMFQMARKGTLWTFGDGRMRFNPIDPRDLAVFTTDRLLAGGERSERRPIGGPEVMDSFGIAERAAVVLERRVKTRGIPLTLARVAVTVIRPFAQDLWQMGDFFIGNVEYAKRHLNDDASMPAFGQRTLGDYFRERLARETASSTSL